MEYALDDVFFENCFIHLIDFDGRQNTLNYDIKTEEMRIINFLVIIKILLTVTKQNVKALEYW